jgi:AraC family transcriptional regulator, regulatory protein of adaptative response / methylated-DNA-[protein]-cysteine methyltransferase
MNAKLTQKMHALCRYIREHADTPLTLAALSQRAHLSPFHLQRSFKAAVGMTPKEYLAACRAQAFKRGLRNDNKIAAAVYAAGYGSGSRVYERLNTNLGMTPKQYRAGGAGVAISYITADTALGVLMMAATDRGLCFVQFDNSATKLLAQLRDEYPQAAIAAAHAKQAPAFKKWMQLLRGYIDGKVTRLDLPLDVRGTAFQLLVWRYLQSIPYGSVQSYSEVAAGIGKRSAVRAVASACAANNVAMLIPCHRVIRGDGSLGGYRWGLARKRVLLDKERSTFRAAAANESQRQ